MMNRNPFAEKPSTKIIPGQFKDSTNSQFEDAPEESEDSLLSKNCDKSENVNYGMNSMKSPTQLERHVPPGISSQEELCAKNDHSTANILECEIRDQDVLFGRGARTNLHAGNIYFRSIVDSVQLQYASAPKMDKKLIASQIVHEIKLRKGRFLKKDEKAGRWMEVCDTKSRLKTSQALREGLANKTRQALKLSNRNM